jgi:threonine synthase
MKYISTRSSSPTITSKEAIIKGIATDNGLYVPSSFPSLGSAALESSEHESYVSRSAKILRAFLSDFASDELTGACRAAYSQNFDTPIVAPLQILGDKIAVLELWHGPTLAFKDMALQLMPWLLKTAILSERDAYKIVILVATSGDTGKAALEGFADVEGVSIFVFYPHEGISEIQRLQMVTQRGSNIGVCGVLGNFDDAQSGVKQIFSDPEINSRLERSRFRFSSANSINWGRLAPQIVYYFSVYEDMILTGQIKRGQPINICIPTGNFGNILAAYYAFKCGLPISKLICASNINKVLTDFIRSGIYDRRREFYKTDSPSMDILISSNLERLLFELADRKAGTVLDWMKQLATQGRYQISHDALDQLQSLFYGGFADYSDTLKAIKEVFEKYGYLMDPHSAVGYSVLQRFREETGDMTPTVLASTASPFKFNRAVMKAIGRDPSDKDEFSLLYELSSIIGQPVPAKLAELKSLPEIHRNVCEIEGMAEAILKFLEIN